MHSGKWLVLAAVTASALVGCGEDSDPRALDGGTMDASGFLPPPGTLPPEDPAIPPATQYLARQNPFIYINDYPDSVYTDAYMFALAANADAKLVGVVSSGIDCNCSAGDNVDPSARRQQWIDAARLAGFQNIPDNISGGFGAPMMKPASGVVSETVRQPTPGSALIVDQAKRATPEIPLVVVSGGPITPLADAYLQDPSITQTTVVSWIVGAIDRDGDLSLTTDYRATDPWAAEIVLRNFRVFVFPINVDPPLISECRIDAELPDSPLRDLLFGAGYFVSGRDADGAAAVTINFPDYLKEYMRVAMTTELESARNKNGNVYVLTKGDAAGGGDEWFKELRKAYKLPPMGPSFASSDAGCTQ